MANRSIFSRNYTSFNSGGQEVYLPNGRGVAINNPVTRTFVANDDIVAGDAVIVDAGTGEVKPGTATTGTTFENGYGVIGFALNAASAGQNVEVVVDEFITLNGNNITGAEVLVPGETYYLSQFLGQVTQFSTASGQISSTEYEALAEVGRAVSTTVLEIEVQPPVRLFS